MNHTAFSVTKSRMLCDQLEVGNKITCCPDPVENRNVNNSNQPYLDQFKLVSITRVYYPDMIHK